MHVAVLTHILFVCFQLARELLHSLLMCILQSFDEAVGQNLCDVLNGLFWGLLCCWGYGVLIFAQLFFKAIEEFLCVTSDLRASSGSNVFFHLLPVFPEKLDSFDKLFMLFLCPSTICLVVFLCVVQPLCDFLR